MVSGRIAYCRMLGCARGKHDMVEFLGNVVPLYAAGGRFFLWMRELQDTRAFELHRSLVGKKIHLRV